MALEVCSPVWRDVLLLNDETAKLQPQARRRKVFWQPESHCRCSLELEVQPA
jgi:hypothetical protein